MTEIIASFVSQAIQTTSDLLFCEAASLSSIGDDIQRLQAERNRIQCLLRDIDRSHDHDRDDCVRNWISEVREVSFDVDDLVESYAAGFPSPCFFKIFHLRRIRAQIETVRTRMVDILRSKQTYGIEFGRERTGFAAEDLQKSLRRSFPNEDDCDCVVRLKESLVEALISRLTKIEDRLCVVSVVGMGGLGKTTLAKTVYNNPIVKSHFDCCAWVCVSQRYVVKDVLSEILVQIGFKGKQRSVSLEEKRNRRELLEKLKENDLFESIETELKEKRYLIVLDDIWTIQAWDAIKRAFPKGKKGSKFLFTTRNKEVALLADSLSIPPIEPPFLTFEESLELLRRKAFPSEIDFPLEFKNLAKEMVKKCSGLPLAIVVLGGLLRKKILIDEWKIVRSSVIEYEGVNEILALSYYDLPYQLKPCFLFLSGFPEDREIPKKTLIELWIAEGFVESPVEEEEDETILENIAERYLQELVDRCVLQVSKRNDSGIGVKSYQVHDLMREFCVSKARDENFFRIIHQRQRRRIENSPTTMIGERRIAIHTGCDFDERYKVRPNLRSLLCFAIGGFSAPCLKDGNFELLRSLELGFNRFKVTFEALKLICNLRHLRYLGLRDTGIQKLPDSIGNLRQLRTIDLRDNREIWTLPSGISRLTRLKHLLISSLRLNYRSQWTSSAIFRMNNLRYFSLGNHKTWIGHDSLIKLTSLQALRIELAGEEEATALLKSPVVRSGGLRSLDLEIPPGNSFPILGSLSRCRNLSTLTLQGQIRTGISCASFLRRSLALTKLTLKHSRLGRDPMPVLEKLPELRILRLSDEAYVGPVLLCASGGFPRLETFHVCRLSGLKEWVVEEGSMVNLKSLVIEDSPALKAVPDGLRFAPSLWRIEVVDMAECFQDRLRVNSDGIVGEDYEKVCHVSTITFIDTRNLHGINDFQ